MLRGFGSSVLFDHLSLPLDLLYLGSACTIESAPKSHIIETLRCMYPESFLWSWLAYAKISNIQIVV